MKLPTRQIGGVQEKVGVGPAPYKQLGEAIGGAFDTAAGLAGEMVQIEADRKTSDAILNMTSHQSKIEEDYSHQRSFTWDEVKGMDLGLPKETTHDDVLQEDGTHKSVGKDEIQAEEVYPAFMLRQGREQIAIQAEKIPGAGRRREFEQRQEVLLLDQYDREVVKAADARERKLITDYENRIGNAEINGDYDVARTLVKNHPSITDQGERDKEVTRLYQAEESRHLFQVRNHGTIGDMLGEIKRLENTEYGDRKNDGSFHNSMTQKQRDAEVGKLEATVKAIEADMSDASKVAMGKFYSGFYEQVDNPNTTRAEGLAIIDRGLAQNILDDGDVTRLRKYVNDAKGGGGIQDRQTGADASFIKMDNLTMAELQQADMDGKIDALAGVITVTQLEHLKNKAKEGTSNDAAWKENVDYAEAEMGLVLPKKPSDKEKQEFAAQQSAIRELLYSQFRAFEKEHGEPPDADQRRAITDRLLISTSQEKKRRGFMGLWGPHEYRNKEDKLADVPYAQWAQINDILAEVDTTGLPPTASDFKAMSDVLIAIEDAGWDYPSTADVLEAIDVIESGGDLDAWAKKKRRKPRKN